MRLFEERVKLEPVSHRYYDGSGREYVSLSKVRECIKPHFEKDRLSMSVARKLGVSQEEVLGEWKKKADAACDIGTRIHEAMELYSNMAKVRAEDEVFRPMIESVNSLHKDYYSVLNEVCLYDEDYGIAGTADRVMVTTKHKNSIIDICDFKTNLSKGIYYESKYKKYLLGPFSHVQDCNYYDYSLQLSCYAYMLEKLTGRKIGKLNIIYIPPSNPLAWRVIPVNYMKMEVVVLFDYWKSLRSLKVESVKKEEFSELPNFG